MEESNGSLKTLKPMAVCGNPLLPLDEHINGHAVVPRRRKPAQGPSFVARGFSIVAR